jgi:hypothetical protein
MNDDVFAYVVVGEPNVGKTSSLRILAEFFKDDKRYMGDFLRRTKKDFTAIFRHKETKMKIGIRSMGDTLTNTKEALLSLINRHCDIVVIVAHPNFADTVVCDYCNSDNVEIIVKIPTATDSKQEIENTNFAKKLFDKINYKIDDEKAEL